MNLRDVSGAAVRTQIYSASLRSTRTLALRQLSQAVIDEAWDGVRDAVPPRRWDKAERVFQAVRQHATLEGAFS